MFKKTGIQLENHSVIWKNGQGWSVMVKLKETILPKIVNKLLKPCAELRKPWNKNRKIQIFIKYSFYNPDCATYHSFKEDLASSSTSKSIMTCKVAKKTTKVIFKT